MIISENKTHDHKLNINLANIKDEESKNTIKIMSFNKTLIKNMSNILLSDGKKFQTDLQRLKLAFSYLDEEYLKSKLEYFNNQYDLAFDSILLNEINDGKKDEKKMKCLEKELNEKKSKYCALINSCLKKKKTMRTTKHLQNLDISSNSNSEESSEKVENEFDNDVLINNDRKNSNQIRKNSCNMKIENIDNNNNDNQRGNSLTFSENTNNNLLSNVNQNKIQNIINRDTPVISSNLGLKNPILEKEMILSIYKSKFVKKKIHNDEFKQINYDLNNENKNIKSKIQISQQNQHNRQNLLINDINEFNNILKDENALINFIKKLSQTAYNLRSDSESQKQFLKSNLRYIISSKFNFFLDINNPGCIFRDKLSKLEYFKNRIKKAITELYAKITDINDKEKILNDIEESVDKAEDKHFNLKQNLSYLREKLKLLNRQSNTFDNVLDNDYFK